MTHQQSSTDEQVVRLSTRGRPDDPAGVTTWLTGGMLRPPLPQDEPFTTSAAGRLGYTRKELSRLVDARVLRRLFTSVYLRSDVALTDQVRLRAAGLAVGKGAVLCDRTAAWVWGVDVHRYAELDSPPPVEAYTLRGRRELSRAGCDGGSRDLRAEDWCTVDGVRVTTPLRTALDLACNLPRREALAALDALARAHNLTAADLAGLLPRFRRRRGVVQARQLVPLVDPRAESPPESWMREILDAHGFPPPEPQHWVVIDGVPTYRLDLAYPRARIAIEYDGEEHHSSPDARERDRIRRERLRDEGWFVLVLTKASFTPDAVTTWTTELREVLLERRRSHKRF